MRRLLVGSVLPLWLSGLAWAQGFVDGLTEARAKIEAAQWTQALELLVPLQEKAGLDEDLEALASALSKTGEGLYGASNLVAALRACTAALAVRKRLRRDADDLEVAV